MMRSWIGAALLALGVAATLAVEPAAAQQGRWREVDGFSVGRVKHNGGGSFAETHPGQWTEFGVDGRPIHRFTESERDAFRVTLIDGSRAMTLLLDLRSGEIRRLVLFRSPRVLYTITAAEPRRREWGRAPNRYPPAAPQGPQPGANGNWNPRDGGDVGVGPIWNQRDAEIKCRAKAQELGVEWSGSWTSRNGTSVCGMRGRAGPGGAGTGGPRGPGGPAHDGVLREIEVGPIWNQRDAETKCRAEANRLRADWTGQWRTTQQGRMSVCEIRFR